MIDTKYDEIIESNILAKKIKMKINEYNSLENEYNDLLKKEIAKKKKSIGGWEKIKGELTEISASGKDWLWGINEGKIYTCKKPCKNGDWKHISGELIQLDGGNKEVWGVNKNDNIYKMNQDHSNEWRKIPGKLMFVSQGEGWIWGINKDNQVYRCKSPCNGDWILDLIPSPPGITKIFNYLGNWKDERSRRLPVVIDKGNRKYTQASCNKACQDYKYYGLQAGNGYKGQCFCGNSWTRATSLGRCGGSKITGGGWCNSIYETKKEDELITINVGQSRRQRTKKVSLPYDNMIVSPYALNEQNPRWGDRFEVKVNGRELTVTRTDANAGWGQNLKLQGIRTDIPSTNNVQEGPKMEMLSCSKTYVYGVDNNNKLWRKNIDGTGQWKIISNVFAKWVSASNKDNVYIVNNNNEIKKAKHSNINLWRTISSNNLQINIKSISADPNNDDIYVLPEQMNNNNGMPGPFLYTPTKNNDSWTDIIDQNYFKNLITTPGTSNSNFKFLGYTDTLKDCKIKSLQDKKNEFSSITYVTDESKSGFKKACYANYVGGKNNPTNEKDVITSLAPNGTTIIGGEEGKKLLKSLRDTQEEIKELLKKQKSYNNDLVKTNDELKEMKEKRNKNLNTYIEKLRLDRIEIDKILDEPQDSGMEIKSQKNQLINYFHYLLWVLLVIISVILASYLLINDKEKISVFTYIFAGVWILILGFWYIKKIMYYSGKAWHNFANLIVT
tara:strand:+ start:2857 stop:5037 length:2181 start_codon:yes stop_codon:yes gene_type:complete